MTYVQDSAIAEDPAKVEAFADSTPASKRAKHAATVGVIGAVFAGNNAQAQQITSDRFPCPIRRSGPQPPERLAAAASFGYTVDLHIEIQTMGYDNWLQSQLNHTQLDEWHKFEKNLADTNTGYGYDTIFHLPGSNGALNDICPTDGASRRNVRRQLVKARVIRALYSPAQLFERMVEFWTDHLNTWHLTPNIDRMKTFEDQLIREHALGNLSDLIYASATSPAMLKYLDGNVNVAGNPNENYARELLELHTLGADVCYDESTIEVLARALTGWRVDLTNGMNCGVVTFNNSLHDNSAKALSFPGCGNYFIPANSGQAELGLVVDILTDPNKLGRITANFIATKMASYFMSCNPKKLMINEMVEAYVQAQRSTQSDIAAMVEVMFSTRWIRCSEPVLKRPLHLMTSAIRGLGGDVTEPGFVGDGAVTLVGDFLTPSGHVPYNWPAPDGYPPPCATEYWASNLLPRWSLGASIANDEFDFVNIDDFRAAIAHLGTAEQIVDFINQHLFAGFWKFEEFTLVIQYLNTLPTLGDAAVRLAVGLAIGSPSFSNSSLPEY